MKSKLQEKQPLGKGILLQEKLVKKLLTLEKCKLQEIKASGIVALSKFKLSDSELYIGHLPT